MDFNKLKDYYKRTEIENIHWEIFKETPEYKNYCLGVAQGIYIIYDFINMYKDQINNNENWLELIRETVTNETKIKEYFNRLLDK